MSSSGVIGGFSDAAHRAGSLGWEQPLNAIVGDAGFSVIYAREPQESDREADRICAHLLYVANCLRSRPPHALSPEAQTNRSACLASLEEYALAGRFPKHSAPRRARKPIFIDSRGTPCAVAHLMLSFGAEDLCWAIDASHRNALIEDLLTEAKPALVQRICGWCLEMGLEPGDLAIIQPAYTEEDVIKLSILAGIITLMSVEAFVMGVGGIVFVLLDGKGASTASMSLAALGITQCSLLSIIICCSVLQKGRHLVVLALEAFVMSGLGSFISFSIVCTQPRTDYALVIVLCILGALLLSSARFIKSCREEFY
mmetsp:Transcript_3144/g.7528  ORF Transcript_3144/g.7528 Transcript_3144/m.7528 type:complete len:313 (-) Transcript_3144:248-1186(-)